MFYGGPLDDVHLLEGLRENDAFLASLVDPQPLSRAALDRRPVIKVAMFWSRAAEPPLHIRNASAHGSYYPAYGDREAAFVHGLGRRGLPQAYRVEAAGLELLKRQRIPVRLQPSAAP